MICRVLDITNAGNVKVRFNPKGVHIMDTLTNGGTQERPFITESNLKVRERRKIDE